MKLWWHFIVVAGAGALVFLVVETLYHRYVDKGDCGCDGGTKKTWGVG